MDTTDATLRDDFLASARLGGELVAHPAVADRWDDESACAGMTVGGLAHHLSAQWGHAVRCLDAEPADLAPISLAEHYRRAAWVTSGLDEEPNTAVRDAANSEASLGHEAVLASATADLEALPRALAIASARRPGAVLIPWQGWALTTHDFLVIRLMEIVVHSDDLAASLDVATPEFPDLAVREVLGLLTSVAVGRHGQTAVIRSLTRPQRAPASVTAF